MIDLQYMSDYIDVECLLIHLSSQRHFPLNSSLGTSLWADRWSGGWNCEEEEEEEEECLSSDAQVRPVVDPWGMAL